MSENLPEEIEVKFAVALQDTGTALERLKEFGLEEGHPRESRTINFFDLPGLLQLSRGVIVRLRALTGGGSGDSTFKVRGDAAGEARAMSAGSPEDELKFEGDQNAGQLERPSFSIKRPLAGVDIGAVLAGTPGLETLFGSDGPMLLSKFGGTTFGQLCVFGPIDAKIWKLKVENPGFSGKVTAELWDANGVLLLEISDKKSRAASPALETSLIDFMTKTIGVAQLDTSKTQFALKQFEPVVFQGDGAG